MALVTADDSRTPCFGSKNTQTVIAEENEVEKNIKAGVPIFVGGAALGLPVAMRYLIVITIIMRLRFNKFASIVVYAWGDTTVEFASCLMMMHLKNSIIAMLVAFAGLGGCKFLPL
ncbi:Hypothetical predicted protein [Olea europaea subsp. europaea]|uniref:Uncharacterized protein n=1 Tax=Olea europaea subsp. europaea TaxID=158383 RepID=A0A8S0Q6T5_OLEEU|nr:Hypothetical predicted protein [Olea europaea subsp. europaea]